MGPAETDEDVIRLRAPRAADRDAVYATIAARDRADLGEVEYQPEDLDAEWRLPGFDLGRDAKLAELPGTGVVGYAAIRAEGAIVIGHPRHERAVVAELLRWTEARERELGRPCHRRWLASTDEYGISVVQEHGYRRARSVFRLQRPLAASTAPGSPPAGVALRQLDPEGDAAAVHAVDAAAFAGADDYVPAPLEAFRAEHLVAHDLDRGASLVACAGDRVVGFLLARRWAGENSGFVDLLAVDPAEQGRGIGAALLRAAFAQFAAAGLVDARLGVTSTNRRALRLYEGLGMTERYRFDIYERPTEPARTMPRSSSDSVSV